MIYDSLLTGVSRPCRYLNSEWNAVHKEHAKAKAKVCLCYPDVYEVGMSHLGLKILYHVLNSHPDYLAERAFAPWHDMEAALRQSGTALVSLESTVPLAAFDLVGFTLSSELTYTNILTMLDLGGIPLRAAQRTAEHPIVLGGGSGAGNPEPLADFFDAFFLGEAEEAILEIAAAVADNPPSQGRQVLLERLAQIPGVYVPSLYDYENTPSPEDFTTPLRPRAGAPQQVHYRFIEDFDSAPYPTRQIVPYLETIHDRITLEIMRGCTRGCRFCQAGMTYRPMRQRRVETLLQQAQESIAATGMDEISLLGFNSPDFEGVEDLIDRLLEAHGDRKVSISLPSSRTDTFTVELAKRLARVRRPGLTFAPEAGTQRLRDVINKQVTEEDLFNALGSAFEEGWQAVKLYFMIGLPTETVEDVEAIADLLQRAVALGKEKLGAQRGRLRISASIGSFIPKPHTPFQWWGQEEGDLLREKHDLLKRTVRAKDVKLSWNDSEISWLEATLARGDRRLSEVIFSAWQAGARFDAWAESYKSDIWRQAIRQVGLDELLFAHRCLQFEDVLPWDHLSFGVTKEFLRREAQAAVEGKITEDCRRGECSDCGVCAESSNFHKK